MGAKRKHASPKASPKPKKAKVEADPVADAVKQLVTFFDKTALIPDAMEDAVNESARGGLYPSPEDRHPLEQIFAKAVGEVLKVTVGTIDDDVKKTTEAMAAVEAEEAGAQQTLDAAAARHNATKDQVQTAKAAERAAEEARNNAVEAHETHIHQVKNLVGEKKKLMGEETDLAAGLELLKGPGSKQDAKKIVALLKSAGVSDACCLALPNALGKTGGFEEVVLAEATKALGAAYNEVTGKQKNWEEHCQQMSDSTSSLLDQGKAGAEMLASRTAETSGAAEEEKAAKKARKDAEGKLADAKKEVASQGKISGKANAAKEAADWAGAAYEMLLLRPAPAAEPEPAADAADMQTD